MRDLHQSSSKLSYLHESNIICCFNRCDCASVDYYVLTREQNFFENFLLLSSQLINFLPCVQHKIKNNILPAPITPERDLDEVILIGQIQNWYPYTLTLIYTYTSHSAQPSLAMIETNTWSWTKSLVQELTDCTISRSYLSSDYLQKQQPCYQDQGYNNELNESANSSTPLSSFCLYHHSYLDNKHTNGVNSSSHSSSGCFYQQS